jgi:hypothetical protein
VWLAPCPEVGDRPLLWKELHVEYGHRSGEVRHVLVPLAIYAFLGGWTFFVAFHDDLVQPRPPGRLRLWFQVAAQPVAWLAVVAVAVRAAGTWTRDRERRTLDDLLVTGLTNAELVGDKWWGSLWSLRGVWWYLAVVLYLTAAFKGIPLSRALVLGLAWVVYAALAASLGGWCSLRCRSTWRATVLTLGLLLGMTGAHWLLYWGVMPVIRIDENTVWLFKQFHYYAFTPPVTLDPLEPHRPIWVNGEPFPDPSLEMEFPFRSIGLCLFGLLAVLLRLRISSHFASVTGRMPVGRPPRAPPPTPARS